MIAIVFGLFLSTVIALLDCASLRMNKFQSFFALVMTFPFPISVIAAKSLWYLILLLWSCLREIRLELRPGVRATLSNLVLPPPASSIKTVPISSVPMTWSTAVTKSKLLALMLLKKLQLLHR